MKTAFLPHKIFGLVTAMLMLTIASAQERQVPPPTEIGVLTRYEVKHGDKNKLEEAIRVYVQLATANKANIMAEAYYEQDTASVLWIIERWNNMSAFEELRQDKKIELAQPARMIYIRDLEPISKDEWRRQPGKDDQPITIMLFVDSEVGTEEKFKTTYHIAMPLFRSEPGVINYQLSQLEEDSSQFVTYEKFRNEDAFQFHLNFPPIQPVIDYLNTSIKRPPFQAGLHRLVPLPANKN